LKVRKATTMAQIVGDTEINRLQLVAWMDVMPPNELKEA